MTWFRIDDGFYDHPKVQKLLDMTRGRSAIALWTLAGSWSSKHLTDGNVTRFVCKRLGFSPSDAKALVECGLWKQTENGYVFHDWTDCNQPRSEVEASRKRSKNKVSAWRNRVTDEPKEPDRNPVCNPVTEPVTNQVCNPSPIHTIPYQTKPNPKDNCLRRPPSGGSIASQPTDVASPKLAKRKPSQRPSQPSASSAVWDAYAAAYEQRYLAAPVRNARVNAQLAQFVARIPATEAPHVAAWYVGSKNQWYVQAGHSVGLLLRDAEKLRTEWLTQRRGTQSQAREIDRSSELLDWVAELEDKALEGGWHAE